MQYRLVSTIIATHNRPELITRTLDSLSRQTYRPLEVLVIDDGSQPPAQPLIDRWRACVDEDLHVSCLRQNNQGPAAARNKGIEQCSGDLIHFLDDDDLLDEHALEYLVHAITDSTPQVSMSSYLDWRSGQPFGSVQTPPTLSSRDITRAMIGGNWFVPIHGYLFTRSAIEVIGSWNTVLTSQEDDEYLLRAAFSGILFKPAPRAMVYYCHHEGIRRATPGKPGESIAHGLKKRMMADLTIREFAYEKLAATGSINDYLDAFIDWQNRFLSRYGELEAAVHSPVLDWLAVEQP